MKMNSAQLYLRACVCVCVLILAAKALSRRQNFEGGFLDKCKHQLLDRYSKGDSSKVLDMENINNHLTHINQCEDDCIVSPVRQTNSRIQE